MTVSLAADSGYLQSASHVSFLLWLRLIIILTGAQVFLSTAVSAQAGEVEPNAKQGLRVCLPAFVETLDPTDHRSRNTQIVLKNIFDSLTARDNNNTVLPQLAESWELINPTTWRFRLRRGVVFHNGQPFTSADVKFTLDRVVTESGLDGRTSPRRSLLEPISKVETEDQHTVRIITRFPWPILPLLLSLQEIIPEAYHREVGSREFAAHPVGTGPFKFAQVEPDKEILLERFQEYYGGSPLRLPVQPARLKEVRFKVVVSRLDQVAMLKSGQCDIVGTLSPESKGILDLSPDIDVITVRATKSYFAEINSSRPPLNDMRVRQALNFGIDMEAMVRHKLEGQGEVLATVVLPNAFGYNERLQPYPYDPETASHLLDAASYPADRPLVVYYHKENMVFADSIALYLTKLGLAVKMVLSPEFRPREKGPEAPWDIYVGSWGNTTLEPAGILVPKFTSKGKGNYSGLSSPELDRLIRKAGRTIARPERSAYYRQVQTILFNQAPMIFGYAPYEHYGVADRVRNFTPSSTGMIELHDVFVDQGE